MAEFKEVCRQWCRMCREQYGGCGEGCPMGENDVCGFTRRATDADIEQAERIIMNWAKEHPEPVYPTWFEWLEDIGIVSKAKGEYSQIYDTVLPTLKIFDPIPVDIAEKLGIKPKEG